MAHTASSAPVTWLWFCSSLTRCHRFHRIHIPDLQNLSLTTRVCLQQTPSARLRVCDGQETFLLSKKPALPDQYQVFTVTPTTPARGALVNAVTAVTLLTPAPEDMFSPRHFHSSQVLGGSCPSSPSLGYSHIRAIVGSKWRPQCLGSTPGLEPHVLL